MGGRKMLGVAILVPLKANQACFGGTEAGNRVRFFPTPLRASRGNAAVPGLASGSVLGAPPGAGGITASAGVHLVGPQRFLTEGPGDYRASQQKRPLHRLTVRHRLSNNARALSCAGTEAPTRKDGRAGRVGCERQSITVGLNKYYRTPHQKACKVRLSVGGMLPRPFTVYPNNLHREPRQNLPCVPSSTTVCQNNHYRVSRQILPCVSSKNTVGCDKHAPLLCCKTPNFFRRLTEVPCSCFLFNMFWCCSQEKGLKGGWATVRESYGSSNTMVGS